jgi:hypothetical protein
VCPRGEEPPQLAIIAGNPFAPGRRYILLLYERDGHPAAVVKVGLTAHAAALIRQETNALQAIAARTNIAPRVLATHECGNARAVALEHLAGHAPNRAAAGDIARVLVPWIDTRRSVHAHEVPAWQRLCEAAPPQPALAAVRARIESLPFHPALYHGDFAPWNVKVQPDGTWRVLDWERGELTGMPCWDWFHHRVQVGLLVERLPTVAHARAIERLLQHREFLRYAEFAGVEGMVQEWFLAYLLYSIHIIGPKESLPGKQALFDTLAAQWKSG